MYTWGYVQDATLAKLDMDDYNEQDDSTYVNLTKRFPIYANEAMTQICSSVKPKRTFYKIAVYDRISYVDNNIVINGKIFYNCTIQDDLVINENGIIVAYPIGHDIIMPNDFISFSDDNSTVEYKDFMNNSWLETCHDDTLEYVGYNTVICKIAGNYKIAYNARWFNFEGVVDTDIITAPNDVIDCIPSYIASQCYMSDDEYKHAAFRNEYEMFVARIDDTDFKNTHTIKIEGDW